MASKMSVENDYLNGSSVSEQNKKSFVDCQVVIAVDSCTLHSKSLTDRTEAIQRQNVQYWDIRS